MVDSLELLGTCVGAAVSTSRRRRLIIAAWLCLALVLAPQLPLCLQDATPSLFVNPESTESSQTMARVKRHFPDYTGSDFVFGVQAPDDFEGSVEALPGFAGFSAALLARLNDTGEVSIFRNVLTYNKYLDKRAASVFLSADRRCTFTMIMFSGGTPDSHRAMRFARRTKDLVRVLRDEHLPPGTSVYACGTSTVLADFADLCFLDLAVGAFSTIPPAVAIIAAYLGSFRLQMLTLLNIGVVCTIIAGVMHMRGIINDTGVFVEPLSMSVPVIVAWGLDFGLLIFSRLAEELSLQPPSNGDAGGDGAGPRRAMVQTMKTSGFTVVCSGAIFSMSFVVMYISPVPAYQETGFTTGLGVVLLIVAYLTLTPAIVLEFPGHLLPSGPKPPADPDAPGGARGPESSTWEAIAGVSMHPMGRAVCLLCFAAIAVASAHKTLQVEESMGNVFVLGLGSKTQADISKMVGTFGPGLASPISLVIAPHDGGSIMRPQFWESSRAHLERIHATFAPYGEVTILFPSYVALPAQEPIRVSYPMMQLCRMSDWRLPNCGLLRQVINDCTRGSSPPGSALLGRIIPHFDPLGPDGPALAEALRRVAADCEGAGYTCSLDSATLFQRVDLKELLDSSVIPLCIVMSCSCFAVLAVAFKSIIVPLRCILSTGMTVLVSYAASVVVYQDGALEWTGLAAFGRVGSQSFTTNCICIPLITGLCLDYEVFLLTSTMEFYSASPSAGAVDAVQRSVVKTGWLITMAGLCMSLAMAVLINSSFYLMIQVGFLLIVAVLFNTFLVRPFLSPTLSILLGRYLWWPWLHHLDREHPKPPQKVQLSLRSAGSPEERLAGPHLLGTAASESGGCPEEWCPGTALVGPAPLRRLI